MSDNWQVVKEGNDFRIKADPAGGKKQIINKRINKSKMKNEKQIIAYTKVSLREGDKEVTIEERVYNVANENDKYVVLDDEHFSKVTKPVENQKISSYGSYLGLIKPDRNQYSEKLTIYAELYERGERKEDTIKRLKAELSEMITTRIEEIREMHQVINSGNKPE